MTEPTSPEVGHTYKSPINVIGTEIENFNVPDMGVRIDRLPIQEKDGELWHVLSYEAKEFERTWEILYIKMEWFVTSLSIGTISHCWLSDYIYDENGQEVWRKPVTLRMVVEKEGDPLVNLHTPSQMASTMIDLSFHIARFYPRVSVYHHIGLLLLRTPLLALNLNAEILLNFYKIGELIAASRANVKPNLMQVVKISKELNSSYDASGIREFYKVRSRDAAHDYGQAENINRTMATDCKLWAEELVIKDWKDRGAELLKRSDGPRFPLRDASGGS